MLCFLSLNTQSLRHQKKKTKRKIKASVLNKSKTLAFQHLEFGKQRKDTSTLYFSRSTGNVACFSFFCFLRSVSSPFFFRHNILRNFASFSRKPNKYHCFVVNNSRSLHLLLHWWVFPWKPKDRLYYSLLFICCLNLILCFGFCWLNCFYQNWFT